MSWLGQHIWGFISRFRNKIYIETIQTGTSNKVLVRESNGLVKEKDCLCATGNEVREVRGTAPILIDNTDAEKPIVSVTDATRSASGLMTKTEFTKLEGIATGADVTPAWLPASDPSYLTALTTPFKSLTSTGTSGAATLSKGILNIPQYTTTTVGFSGKLTVLADVVRGVNSYLEITVVNGLIISTKVVTTQNSGGPSVPTPAKPGPK